MHTTATNGKAGGLLVQAESTSACTRRARSDVTRTSDRESGGKKPGGTWTWGHGRESQRKLHTETHGEAGGSFETGARVAGHTQARTGTGTSSFAATAAPHQRHGKAPQPHTTPPFCECTSDNATYPRRCREEVLVAGGNTAHWGTANLTYHTRMSSLAAESLCDVSKFSFAIFFPSTTGPAHCANKRSWRGAQHGMTAQVSNWLLYIDSCWHTPLVAKLLWRSGQLGLAWSLCEFG